MSGPRVLLFGVADAASEISAWLTRLGCRVDVATSDTDAVTRFGALSYQAVLAALDDSGLRQLTTLARLRELPGGQDAMVIAITAATGPALDRLKSFGQHLGVDAYLGEPVEQEPLRAQLADLLGGEEPAAEEVEESEPPEEPPTITEQADGVSAMQPHERLGISESADRQAIESAYLSRVAHWHRQTAAARSAGDLQQIQRVQDLLRAARDTLLHPVDPSTTPPSGLAARADSMRALSPHQCLGVPESAEPSMIQAAYLGQLARWRREVAALETSEEDRSHIRDILRSLERAYGAMTSDAESEAETQDAFPRPPAEPPAPVPSLEETVEEPTAERPDGPAPPGLEERVRTLTEQSPWERLGVLEGSDPAMIQGAFLGQLGRWQRELIAPERSEADRELIRAIIQLLREAWDSLSPDVPSAPPVDTSRPVEAPHPTFERASTTPPSPEPTPEAAPAAPPGEPLDPPAENAGTEPSKDEVPDRAPEALRALATIAHLLGERAAARRLAESAAARAPEDPAIQKLLTAVAPPEEAEGDAGPLTRFVASLKR